MVNKYTDSALEKNPICNKILKWDATIWCKRKFDKIWERPTQQKPLKYYWEKLKT